MHITFFYLSLLVLSFGILNQENQIKSAFALENKTPVPSIFQTKDDFCSIPEDPCTYKKSSTYIDEMNTEKNKIKNENINTNEGNFYSGTISFETVENPDGDMHILIVEVGPIEDGLCTESNFETPKETSKENPTNIISYRCECNENKN